MPLLPGARALIEIAVASRTIVDTLIKQKAKFVSLLHQQTEAGESLVIVTVRVALFAADGDGFGPALEGPGFSAYEVQLRADNQTVVDAQTGAILAIRLGEPEADWQNKLASYEQPVMLQGDFFEYLRENQPIKIGEMIRQHITQADAMGRFA